MIPYKKTGARPNLQEYTSGIYKKTGIASLGKLINYFKSPALKSSESADAPFSNFVKW